MTTRARGRDGNRTLQIRLPPEVRERWERAAEAADLPTPEYVRRVVEVYLDARLTLPRIS